MTMHAVALVLAGVACTGHGSRLRKRSERPSGKLYQELQTSEPLADLKMVQDNGEAELLKPWQAIARFVLALTNPAAAQSSDESDQGSQMLVGAQSRVSKDEVIDLLRPSISFKLNDEEATEVADWQQVAKGIASLQQLGYAGDLIGVTERLLQEAEQGDTLAMAALGTMFLFGQEFGLKQNLTWGMHWITRAADLGQADAQALLGFLHDSDALRIIYGYTDFRSDRTKARRLYERAAAGGSLYASMVMGHRYSYGVGVSQNIEVGTVLYEKAAELAVTALDEERSRSVEQSNPVDFGHLTMLARSMPPEDRIDTDHVEYLDYSANAGDLQGMLQMGYLYHTGDHGVPRDLDAARHWFQAVADRSEPQGLANVGMMHLRAGRYDEAVKCFRRAAKRNDLSGWAGLGYAFLYGAGLPQSDALAAKSIWKAACIGHLDSIHNLGVLALEGRGIPHSLQLALRYFIVAAEFGHPQSQLHVGRLSSRGLGLRKDCGTAQFFFKQATEAGPLVRSIMSVALRAHEEKRPQRALLHYLLGAHAGVKMAQYNAGYLLANGKPRRDTVSVGREAATDRAIFYFNLATMQGMMQAQVQLANLLVEKEEFEDAIQLYKEAARDGQSHAMWQLGYLYLHGLGVPRDRATAWALFQSAGMSKDVQLEGFEGLCFGIARTIFENRALITFGSMFGIMCANGLNPFDLISQVQGGLNRRVMNDDVWTGGDDDFAGFSDV